MPPHIQSRGRDRQAQAPRGDFPNTFNGHPFAAQQPVHVDDHHIDALKIGVFGQKSVHMGADLFGIRRV